MKKIGLLFVFTVLIGSLVGCGAKEEKEKKVTIAFPSGGGSFAGGVLGEADVQGYLKQYLEPLGYEVCLESFPGAAPAIHEALISKEIDYVVYAGMAGVLGKSNGIDTKLLAVTGYACSWRLVVRNDANIQSLQDLEGKKIAYARGASPHLYFIHVLEQAGIRFEQVEAYNMTLADGLSALAAGSVDAAIVTAGQEEELVKEGIVTVLHNGYEQGDTFYEPMVLIGESQALKEKKDATVAVIVALLRARDEIAKDREAFYQLSEEQSGHSLEVVKATSPQNIEIGYPVNLENRYLDSLKQIQKTLIKEELITKEMNIMDWIDDSFLKEARKEYQNEE